MDNNQIAYERRKRRRLETLGTNNPVCVVCGETDWRCLEKHHLSQVGFGDELGIVCRNCHRKLSDMQKSHTAPLEDTPGMMEHIVHFMLGVADLFVLMAEKFREFAHFLAEEARKSISASKEVLNDK